MYYIEKTDAYVRPEDLFHYLSDMASSPFEEGLSQRFIDGLRIYNTQPVPQVSLKDSAKRLVEILEDAADISEDCSKFSRIPEEARKLAPAYTDAINRLREGVVGPTDRVHLNLFEVVQMAQKPEPAQSIAEGLTPPPMHSSCVFNPVAAGLMIDPNAKEGFQLPVALDPSQLRYHIVSTQKLGEFLRTNWED